MFESYEAIVHRHGKLPLAQERRLIALAQKGRAPAQETLLFHLLGFILFRIKATLRPAFVRRYGEDLLQDCLVLAIKNIQTYDLRYKNKSGERQPLHLSTYMWKGVTGLMLSQVRKKKELCCADLPEYQTRRLQ